MIYQFECSKCKMRVEITMKMNDPVPHCIACHDNTLVKKIFTAAPFILKGRGWYRNETLLKPSYEDNEFGQHEKTKQLDDLAAPSTYNFVEAKSHEV